MEKSKTVNTPTCAATQHRGFISVAVTTNNTVHGASQSRDLIFDFN